MTLVELTGHEAGIIVFDNGCVSVLNWIEIRDNCLPAYGPIGLRLSWPQENIFDDVMKADVSDVRAVIPGRVWATDDGYDTDLDVLEDDNNDLVRLFTDDTLDAADLEGTVYTLTDGTKVICPSMWI